MPIEKRFTTGWNDYELIDAGGGKKLERWGNVVTIRPEVQAYFKSGKPFQEWYEIAHWEFIPGKGQSGDWKKLKASAPLKWIISYKSLRFQLELTKFKHLGLFPEQRLNWDFISEHLSVNDKFLNLFAYTGAASLVARSTGAEAIHVDSVKQLITWARDNMNASELEGVKWVHEDALKFASREVKRGNKYEGLIMDPPAWGIGAKKERWKLEEKLEELFRDASQLLSENGFLIVNTYSPKVNTHQMNQLGRKWFKNRRVDVSELWMKSTTGKNLYFGIILTVNQLSQ